MNYEIKTGNNLDILKTMDDESVNCVVTSPPYWGLRDYGIDGQYGLEETPKDYVENLVELFREIKRVLKDNGTVWLNIGDTYSTTPCGSFNGGGFKDKSARTGGRDMSGVATSGNKDKMKSSGVPYKNILGMPWKVAFALQDDGWILRQDIIWHKPNPMPESIKDRCTKAHEYIFLLSKNKKYYYDNEAIKEIASDDKKKNKRDVWTVTTKPFKGAHFAVYPPKLIEPCILAGCPDGGIVLDPFSGSGTTGVVALNNNKKYIGIELNPEFAELSHQRIKDQVPNTLVEHLSDE